MVCYEGQTKCPCNDQSQTCCNTQFLSVLAETPRTDCHSFPAGSRGSGSGFQTTLVWAAAVRSRDAAVGIPGLEPRHGWAAAAGLQPIRHGLGERRELMNLRRVTVCPGKKPALRQRFEVPPSSTYVSSFNLNRISYCLGSNIGVCFGPQPPSPFLHSALVAFQ